jgi:pyrimidine deaminase RibD-like protein
MHAHHHRRQLLITTLALAPATLVGASPAAAQSATLAPIPQPPVPGKSAFLARANALRDGSAREGDQPYGAVIVRDSVIVGEGRSTVVRDNDPTAHSELVAVRDAARRLSTRDLSACEMYSSASPCPMCQGALYWARVRRVFTESTLENGFTPTLGC